MDNATLNIILQAKQEGLDAIKEVTASIKDLQSVVEVVNGNLSRLNDTAQDTFDRLGQIGIVTISTNRAVLDMKDGIKDLTAAVGDVNERLVRLGMISAATTAAVYQLAIALGSTATTASATSGATNAAAFSFLGMGTAMLVVVSILVGLAVVLSPVLVMLVGVVVLLAAFAVGVVAVTAALALAFGPLAALTAGVVMLADRVFNSGVTSIDIMTKFTDKISDIADAWGVKAAPMAVKIMDFFTSLLDPVQKAGDAVLTWFGKNLPTILDIAGSSAKSLESVFGRLWALFTSFFGSMKDHLPTFEKFFGQLVGLGADAITGLVQNLLRLSDWFLQRLPQMAPIVSTVMGDMGNVIQGIGKVAGNVVDWFITNWPEITSTAQQTWDNLKAGWDTVAPILRYLLPQATQTLIGLWKELHDHSDQLKFALFLLAELFGILVAIILFVVTVAAGLVITLIEVISWVQQLVTWIANGIQSFADWGKNTEALQLALDFMKSNLNLVITVLENMFGIVSGNTIALDNIGAAFDRAAQAAWRLWNAASNASAVSRGAGSGSLAGGGGSLEGPMVSAQHGGMVPGLVGAPQIIMAHGGEAILSTDQLDMMISLLAQVVSNTTPRSSFGVSAYGRA
jgi:hypothetical protein